MAAIHYWIITEQYYNSELIFLNERAVILLVVASIHTIKRSKKKWSRKNCDNLVKESLGNELSLEKRNIGFIGYKKSLFMNEVIENVYKYDKKIFRRKTKDKIINSRIKLLKILMTVEGRNLMLQIAKNSSLPCWYKLS